MFYLLKSPLWIALFITCLFFIIFLKHFNNLNLGNFHLSFGIGAFPFSIFASTFNQGDARPDRRKLLFLAYSYYRVAFNHLKTNFF